MVRSNCQIQYLNIRVAQMGAAIRGVGQILDPLPGVIFAPGLPASLHPCKRSAKGSHPFLSKGLSEGRSHPNFGRKARAFANQIKIRRRQILKEQRSELQRHAFNQLPSIKLVWERLVRQIDTYYPRHPKKIGRDALLGVGKWQEGAPLASSAHVLTPLEQGR